MQSRGIHNFRRLVLIYFTFLLIPILVSTILLSSLYLRDVQIGYLGKSTVRIGLVRENMDTAMTSVQRTLRLTKQDNVISIYKMRESAYYQWLTQSQLALYTAANSNISNIIYYDASHDLILSDASCYTKESFYDSYFNSDRISFDDLWEQIDSCSNGLITSLPFASNYQGKNFLIYSSNISHYENGPKLLAFVDIESLVTQIRTSLPTENSTLFITNEDGQVVLETQSLPESVQNAAARLTKSGATSQIGKDIDGFLNSSLSGVLDWKYFLYTPQADVTSDSIWFILLLLATETFVLVMSILFFQYNVTHYYKPLSSIGDIVKKFVYKNDTPQSEYEIISNVLMEAAEFQTHVVETEEAALKLVLVQLVLGHIPELQNNARHILPEGWDKGPLDNDYYCLILFHEQGSEDQHKGNSLMKNIVHQYISSLFIEDIYSNGILALCPFDGEKSSILSRIMKALSASRKLGGKGFYVYISKTYSSITDTAEAYKEICYTVSKGHVNPEIPWVYCEEPVEEDRLPNNYPVHLVLPFRKALEAENFPAIQQNIDKIIAVIQEDSCPLSYARFIVYDIIYSVLHYFYGKGSSNNSALIQTNGFLNVENKQQLLEQLFSIRKMFENCSPSGTNEYSNLAIQYIEEHYADSDFSVQKVSQHLNISSGYLSRNFKAAVGCTPIEYVNRLRIEKAKQLLSETDLPLSEIIQKIGYYDESSFYKKFKAAVGMTPIAYRTDSKEQHHS